jgi:hypothetical protein
MIFNGANCSNLVIELQRSASPERHFLRGKKRLLQRSSVVRRRLLWRNSLSRGMHISRESPIFPKWPAVMRLLCGKSWSGEYSRAKVYQDGSLLNKFDVNTKFKIQKTC